MGGVLLGAASYQIAVNLININTHELTPAIYLASSIIGSISPDIDHGGSYVGRRLGITSKLVNRFLGHRGATHAPIIVALFSLSLFLITKATYPDEFLNLLILGFFTGCISHILLDFLSKGGVPLLYPFSKTKFSLSRFATGGMFENIVFVLLSLSSIYLIIVKDALMT